MAEPPRYRCRDCGNDTRFRAKANVAVDVIVDGRGEITKLDLESQMLEDDPKVTEVTDCLSCGGVNILDLEKESKDIDHTERNG
jgi:hypothetical protein